MMRIVNILCVIVLMFASTSCYAIMRGTVVDAETGQPIEGAVVLVERTKKKGLGLTHTESVKVIEVTTDKQGNFVIPRTLNLGSPPAITIYKKNYVAWNSRFIFPDYSKRTSFQWQNESLFEMERFQDHYSYIKHQSFIYGAIKVSLSPETKRLFLKTYHDSEGENIRAERLRRDKLRIMKERKK